MRWGLKAVIAESFAEIFFGNCGSLGIAALQASREDLEVLGAVIEGNPAVELKVDLESLTVTAGETAVSVSMPDSVRNALLTGEWDFLSQLLGASKEVASHAETVPYLNRFTS